MRTFELRRQRIFDHFCQHGAASAAKEFGISRTRVYQIVEWVHYGQKKPAVLKKSRNPVR
jgi:hypothetical protein